MRIALVNMPFAALGLPSLALTQLAAVLRKQLGDRVQVETHYLNLAFARYLGDPAQYDHALRGTGFMTGVGDWFFRQAAFPDAPDNTAAYFERFYFDDEPETVARRALLRERRDGLEALLDRWIAERDLARADVVGFTALFAQTVASFALARRIKQANPRVCTVIGGATCEGDMGRALASRVLHMDYFFSGPALVSFPAFVQRVLEKQPDPVRGLAGVVAAAPSSPAPGLGEELDIETPLELDYAPYLDALERTFPAGEVRPVLLFETSRGCAWAERSPCTFCGLNGSCRQYRAMSPARGRAEFERLYRWAPRCSSFIAVDTLLPPAFLKNVFPALAPPPGFRMMYEVRPVLSDAQLTTLCAAGIAAVQPGIEALSTSTLRLMRKGTSAFSNLRFLRNCSRHPLALDWNLLIGSPGEPDATFEKYLRDLPLLSHLAPPTGVYPIGFVRHSPYFENPAAYGLELVPQDFYGYTYPFDAQGLRDVAYQFVDRRADPGRLDAWLDRLGTVVRTWRTRWLGQDGQPQARLCFMTGEDKHAVYDSRDGRECVYPLPPAARAILQRLERPLGPAELGSAALPHLAWLQERALVFEEDGHYLSLVVTG